MGPAVFAVCEGTEPDRRGRAARFFLDRQKVGMPAYRPHLEAGEVDALLVSIHWLRQHP